MKAGRADKGEYMSTRMQALNQEAQISLYPESGHAPFYDEPDRFNRELAAFISDRLSPRIHPVSKHVR
jgi:pimeloyl-ACP methyl ester carboxylesterase